MPDYAVGTKFTAKDQVTATYKRMGQAADNFRRRSSSAFRNASKEGYKFGTVMKGILAANAIHGGVGLVTNGIRTAVGSFIEFDDTMVAAAARFDDIGPKAADFRGELDKLKLGARQAGAGTQYALTDIATALDTMAKAGWNSKVALGTVRSFMDLATASGEEFAATVSMGNDLLGAFGLRSSNVQTQIANQARLNDILAKSGLDANGELIDMFETMKMVGPIASTAGVGMEEIVAMAIALSNAGIKGTQAATALKHALLNIPSKKMAAEFKANGVAIADSNGNIRKYSDILTEIGTKLSKLGNREQTQILERIFGLYGIAGGAGLIKNLEGISIAEERLKSAAGTSKDVSDVMEKYSSKIKLARLQNALLDKSFSVLERFEYQGKKGIDALVASISKWNPERLINGIQFIVNGLKALWTIIKPFVPFIPYLIAGFVAFNVTLKAMAILQTVSMFYRLITAARLAIGTMATLNLIMAANPAVLIATAIAAAVVGLIYLEKKFGIFSKAWEYFSTLIKDFMEWIQQTTFWKILSGIANGLIGAGKALINMEIPDTSIMAENSQTAAPNQKEAEARRIQFNGRLDIAGAPQGSTVQSKTTGAPGIDMQLLGVAP